MSAPLTTQGTILGTIQYMAPEQIEGRDADARSDVWAFGCVLYELIAGRRAFEGSTPASAMAAILEREPVPFTPTRASLPPRLWDIIRTCLEKNPDDLSWDKFETFAALVAQANQRTQVLVYSRGSWSDEAARQWIAGMEQRFPPLKGRIDALRVNLERPTFRNPDTAAEILQLVVKLLGLEKAT